MGDVQIDSFKVQGDGMNEKGEEIQVMSGQNELERSNSQPTVASTVNAVTSDNSSNRGGDTYNVVPQKPNRSREAAASR